ncbi:MAG: cytochrome c [Nitrospina sp.]|nr:cytochrome c [Nitrospina sp.]MBT3855617.1 cytochrome c [Nitrospina sp.]MBT4104660.1 cytochrome c [Nitrospina sp.]MBT4390101.1 cytochrome c [Nitrospina sp.]MBT4621106.1 cytochrome c [Nitrospina sp.]
MIYITSKQKKQSLVFLLLALISWASHASANPADLETGRDIFYKHCKACHGDKGDGKTFASNVLNPPPKNFTAKKSKKELTEERMIQSVTKGRKGTAMMPWESRLTTEEIRAVVHYIRKKLMEVEQ